MSNNPKNRKSGRKSRKPSRRCLVTGLFPSEELTAIYFCQYNLNRKFPSTRAIRRVLDRVYEESKVLTSCDVPDWA